MEKTVDFAILKQKIIKIDELFRIHIDKNEECDKLLTLFKTLKAKFESAQSEIKSIKIKNTVLQNKSESAEKQLRAYSLQQSQLQKLQQKYSQLETQSNHTISELQLKYQTACQKLEESRLEKQEVKTIKALPKTKKKICPLEEQLRLEQENEKSEEIEKLQQTNSQLSNDLEGCKHEIAGLKAKICEIDRKAQLEKDSAQVKECEKLEEKEREITKLKSELKKVSFDSSVKNSQATVESTVQTKESVNLLNQKDSEIKYLKNQMKKLEIYGRDLQLSEEKYSAIKLKYSILKNSEEAQETELISLRALNAQLKEENSKLQETVEIQTQELREANLTPTDSQIDLIMKEQLHPLLLSPIVSECRSLSHSESSIAINLAEKFETLRERKKARLHNLRKRQNRRKKSTKVVKNRIKRQPQSVDLLGALLALQKAHINFTISNETILDPTISGIVTTSPLFHNNLGQEQELRKLAKKRKKHLQNQVDNLFNVKNEPDSRSNSRIEVDPNLTVNNSELNHEHVTVEEVILSENARKRSIDDVKSDSGFGNDVTPLESAKKCRILPNSSSESSSSDDEVIENETGEQRRSQRKTKPTLRQRLLNQIKNQRKTNIRPVTVPNRAKSRVEASKKARNCDNVADKRCLNPQGRNLPKIVIQPMVAETPKMSYKRPICRRRQSPRLLAKSPQKYKEIVEDDSPLSPPQSPVQEEEAMLDDCNSEPLIIPLEQTAECGEKMAPTRIDLLFDTLFKYTHCEELVDQVVEEFMPQDAAYVAVAVLEAVAQDTSEKPSKQGSNFAVLTQTQCTMLGFMSKLEKQGKEVFVDFIDAAEKRILVCKNVLQIDPMARMYAAVCKYLQKIQRVRRFCCDMFYLCGDLAVPFFYAILPSWTELLPNSISAESVPVARVLVQIVHLKQCGDPGYHLVQLKDLLSKYYLYPTERWNSDELLKELLSNYFSKPSKSTDFPILLLCQNHPEKWVKEKIDEHFKPVLEKITNDNFKATVIILVGNLSTRFSSKSKPNYLPVIVEWLKTFRTDESVEIVNKSVQYCLNKLKSR